MKKKQLNILLAVLAVAGGAAALKIHQRSSSIGGKPAEVGREVLPNFRAEDVAVITVQSPTAEAVVEFRDGKWVVPAKENFPADLDMVNQLRDAAFNLKVAEAQRVGPSQLGQIKLKKPGEGTLIEEAGTYVSFRDAAGVEIAGLVVGKTLETESAAGGGSPFSMGGGPKSQYVKVNGQENVVYKARDGFPALEADVKNWLDKTNFFKIEKIKSIAVSGAAPEESWTLTRETEGGDLKLADPKPNEQLDPAKTSGPGSAFSWVQFMDVAPSADREKAALDKPLRTAVIETFDGFTYTIKTGAAVAPEAAGAGGEAHYLSFTVDGKFTEQRTPPPAGADGKPAETDEQKKAADEAFAKALEERKKKLAAEQAHKDRIFIVAKSSLDPVLKNRGELLTDQPEPEAAPAFNPGANPPVSATTPPVTAVTPAVEVTPDGKIEVTTPPVSIPPATPEAPAPAAPAPAAPEPAPAETPAAPSAPAPQPEPAPPATPQPEPAPAPESESEPAPQ